MSLEARGRQAPSHTLGHSCRTARERLKCTIYLPDNAIIQVELLIDHLPVQSRGLAGWINKQRGCVRLSTRTYLAAHEEVAPV